MTDSSTVYAVSKSDFQLAGKMELGKSTLKRNEREHSWTPFHFHFSIWKWMNKKIRTWQVNFETEWNENLWTQIHFYFPSLKWMKKKSGIWQIKFEEKNERNICGHHLIFLPCSSFACCQDFFSQQTCDMVAPGLDPWTQGCSCQGSGTGWDGKTKCS